MAFLVPGVKAVAEIYEERSDAISALADVVEWFDSLPASLRQDIEGSGAEPGCIARARRLTQ